MTPARPGVGSTTADRTHKSVNKIALTFLKADPRPGRPPAKVVHWESEVLQGFCFQSGAHTSR